MEINFLKYLRDNPSAYPNNDGYKGTIKPISLQEIENLEQLYNNNSSFPKALKELLYLAGNGCYVLETGLFDSQEEMQTEARELLEKYNKNISRPFFAIDMYNSGDQFIYVYLDEEENPLVHQAYLPTNDNIPTYKNLNKSLSEFIKHRIETFKKGYNPF
ncbi:SMI1/KNR4 family protein [Flavobacterium phragmitis]|uniref:SMI1-KNR4 cell-wall n=1 Tax=Flavobacterium phragmitis TaxID=739143 RepID=A0A1I1WFX0_9FLAO|nr:SMI1/KNR4 family protein [Flavobacterium phragmitis]SFD94047.1 hypothetical protein SAMN05216297_11545 [Flavobacterium phragmitis]